MSNMAAKCRRVDNGPIIPAGDGALERLCPDLAQWPESWRIEPADLAIGQRIVAAITPFMIDLLTQRYAAKTLARHRDHLWMLGGEIIRRRHDDADLARRPVEDLLRDLVEEDGGPLIWPRITESEQNSFDATCRKFHRFLSQQRAPA